LSVASHFKERKVRNRVREQSRREKGKRKREAGERERIKLERGDAAPLYIKNTINAAIQAGPAQ
jgi:hypothetical protein